MNRSWFVVHAKTLCGAGPPQRSESRLQPVERGKADRLGEFLRPSEMRTPAA